MKKSTVYHVMTRPKFFWGVPLDYAAFAFICSLGFGGMIGIQLFNNGLGAVLGTAPIALVFWAIGFFMTRRDPEFFTVWVRSCFKIGSVVIFNGKRHYDP